MTASKFMLAGAAALTLVACGGEKDAAGSGAPVDAKAADIDSGSPLDAPFRLSDAEEADVDALIALIPEDSRPTYESASFDASLGATVVTNLRFADAEDGEAVIVERAELYGVDAEAIDRIQNSEITSADAPFETVFQKVRLLNVRSEGVRDENEDYADIKIGGVEFDTLAVRQGGGAAEDGDEGALAINATSLGGLYFKDIDVTTETGDLQTVKIAAPDLRIVGVAGGRVDAVIAKDLRYDVQQGEGVRDAMREAMGPQAGILLDGPLGGFIAPDNQNAQIETFEWRNIDFSGAIAYGVKGEEPPASERDLMDLGTMNFKGMESYVNGRLAATVGEATVSAMKFAWLIPSDIRLDAKDAVTDYTAYVPDTESPAFAILKERGLDAVKGDGSMAWTWNPDKGDGALRAISNSDGLANMSLDFEMNGATLKDIEEGLAEGREDVFAESMELKSFALKLDDETALDAIFALSALQMGGTGEDLRQSAPALLRLSGAQFAQMNPRIGDYVSAMADFVAKGGSIEIKAAPEEPIGAGALAEGQIAPQALPDVFNLTVTHTE